MQTTSTCALLQLFKNSKLHGVNGIRKFISPPHDNNMGGGLLLVSNQDKLLSKLNRLRSAGTENL